MLDTLLGSKTAEQVILYICYVGEGHIRRIAKQLNLSSSQVDRTIKRFEAGGILVAKDVGRTRVFSINPRLAIKAELIALVDKCFSLMTDAERAPFTQRKRPRRTGKTLL